MLRTDLITMPEERFGGPSQISYMPPWSRNLYDNSSEIEVSCVNIGASTHYTFTARLDVTGADVSDNASGALYRLYCFYFISHLDKSSLHIAAEKLAEILTWQLRPIVEAHFLPAKRRQMKLRRTVRPPVEVVEE